MDEENKKIDINNLFGRLESVESLANNAILKSDSNLGIINEQKSLIESISLSIEALKSDIQEINNYIIIQRDADEDRRFEEEDAKQKQEMMDKAKGIQGEKGEPGVGGAAGEPGVAPDEKQKNFLGGLGDALKGLIGGPIGGLLMGVGDVGQRLTKGIKGIKERGVKGVLGGIADQFTGNIFDFDNKDDKDSNLKPGLRFSKIKGLFNRKEEDKKDIKPSGSEFEKILKSDKGIGGDKVEGVGDKIAAFLDKGKDFVKGLGKKDDGISSYKELIEAGGIVEDTGQVGSGIGAIRSITVKYPLKEDKAFGAAAMMSGKRTKQELETRNFMIQGNSEESIEQLKMPIEEYINKFVFGGFEAGAVTEVSDEEAKKIIEAEDKEYGTIGNTIKSEDNVKGTETDNKKVETNGKTEDDKDNILSGLTKNLEEKTEKFAESPIGKAMQSEEVPKFMEGVATSFGKLIDPEKIKDTVVGNVKEKGKELISPLNEKIENSFDGLFKLMGIDDDGEDGGQEENNIPAAPAQAPNAGNSNPLRQASSPQVQSAELELTSSTVPFINLMQEEAKKQLNIVIQGKSNLPPEIVNFINKIK